MGVQISCLNQYTSYGTRNMHDKFQCCTVDVRAAIMLSMKLVSWMDGYIECSVNVHPHALNLNNQYLTLF